MADFATRIKQLRQEMGDDASQLDLAKALGTRFPELGKLTDRTISSWEAGKPPRWGHALLVARFFDVSLDYIVGWSDVRGHAPSSDADDPGPRADAADAADDLGVRGDTRRADRRRSGAPRGSSERRPES